MQRDNIPEVNTKENKCKQRETGVRKALEFLRVNTKEYKGKQRKPARAAREMARPRRR